MSNRNTHTIGDVRARYTLFKVVICIGILLLLLLFAQLAGAQEAHPNCPIYEHKGSWLFPTPFKTTGKDMLLGDWIQNAGRCELERDDDGIYVDFELIEMLKAYKDAKPPNPGDLIGFEVIVRHDQNGMVVQQIKNISTQKMRVPEKLKLTNFWPIYWSASVPSRFMPIFNDKLTLFPDGTLYLVHFTQ